MGHANQTLWIQSYIFFPTLSIEKVTNRDQTENMVPLIEHAIMHPFKIQNSEMLKINLANTIYVTRIITMTWMEV